MEELSMKRILAGINRRDVDRIFDLSRELCPIGCAEEGDLICYIAFTEGGCNEKLKASCLRDLQQDSLDAAIAAGPDDY